MHSRTFGSVTLKDFQQDAFEMIFHHFESGVDRGVVILPTGMGKTILAAAVAHEAIHSFRRPVLMLAHRKELLLQARSEFALVNLDTGIEMADSKARDEATTLFSRGRSEDMVVLGSVATLSRRKRLESFPVRRFGLIIVDEAHHVMSPSYRRILDYFKGYWLLGITACAERTDGKNLGSVFNRTPKPFYEMPLKTAIELDYLCPMEIDRIDTGISLNGINITEDGDVNLDDLEDRVHPHVEKIANIIFSKAEHRKTMIFAPKVRSAEAIASALNNMTGRKIAASVSCHDSDDHRSDAIQDFKDGRIQFLSNYGIFTEGFNEPSIECLAMARPTMSISLLHQMFGRGTRHFRPQKKNCLVLDLAMQCDGIDFCHMVDLFNSEGWDDGVGDIAKDLVNSGKEKNLLEAVMQAERINYERRKMNINAKLKNVTDFTSVRYDPMMFVDLGLLTYRKSDYEGKWRAQPEQIAKLRKFNVKEPEKYTMGGAQRALEVSYERSRQKLCTVNQMAALVRNGVPVEKAGRMSFVKARETLDVLFKGAAKG